MTQRRAWRLALHPKRGSRIREIKSDRLLDLVRQIPGIVQIHQLDPSYTGSATARANFRLAVWLSLAFVALIWLVQLVSFSFDLGLERLGVRPREWIGLPGILLAPLLHGGFDHLIANSLPLLVLGPVMLHLYPQSAGKVLPAVYFGPGIAVWLFARGSVHVGASGLIYGLDSYIFFAGIIRRDRRAIAASLLVSFMYGSAVWGVLPIKSGMSWETHLAAALIGLVLALLLRHLDLPPRTLYSWEIEGQEEHDSVLTLSEEAQSEGTETHDTPRYH